MKMSCFAIGKNNWKRTVTKCFRIDASTNYDDMDVCMIASKKYVF
jgi:hypothetical protein